MQYKTWRWKVQALIEACECVNLAKYRLILGSLVPLASDKLTGSFFRFWMSAWYSFAKGWVV
jgi:hypothetical protein